MKWLKRILWAVLGLIVLVAVALPFVVGLRPIIGPKARPLTDRRFEATPERLERGRYLATSVSGCLYCHGELDWNAPGFPIKPGTEGVGRSLAEEGLPFVSAPNITPDPETGAGTWTDDMLARAIREGIGHDGRTLFPMMPYTQYRYMSDEDLASVVVYLRSLPAVRKAQAAPAIPFPVNRFINAVPEPVEQVVPQPDRARQVEYGGYLVRIGACRDCHTPQTPEGQPIAALELAGGFVLQGPYGKVTSGNITPDPSGIPYYTEELFLEMMRTGMVKARKIHDQMPWSLYGRQPDDDLKAMFAYLRTVTPAKHRIDNTLPMTACLVCGATHGGGDLNVPPAQ
ncbi:MAG: c-type cytochrome [Vicinamibacterales bacterium]